ncbi:MAG: hypothetical protein M5R36_16400 [Deltaproteobacteria bacterium]|nr:hypothetical protein [Deltaproteobacteria bacterium]
MVPWRGLSLIGTTDTRYEGHPDDFRVTRDAVESFLAEVNGTLPGAHLTIDDVQWTYGGLRPIVESDTAVKEVNKASRRYEIHDHKTEDGIAGLMTVIGGKYTTSRALAEQVVERAAIRMNLPVPARASAAYVLPGGRIGTWAGLQTRLMREFDISADDAELWGRTYGTRAIALAEKASADKKSGERVDPAHIETMAVLDMAVDEEMAQTVGDVVFRRTGLGTTGVLSEAAIKSIASRMGKRLKWSKERVADETRSVSEKLRSRGISPS